MANALIMIRTVPLTPARPSKKPQYGQDATAESGAFETDEYLDDEDFDIEEAIAQLEEYEDEGE